MQSPTYDLGAVIVEKSGGVATAVAAGTGDATATTPVYYSRVAPRYNSAVFAVAWKAVLAATKTLGLIMQILGADDDQGTNAVVLSELGAASVVVATGAGGGSTEVGITRIKASLETAKPYIGVTFTPDLSAASLDTAILGGVLILGSPDVLPAA
jgi:hypothetical protein